MIASYLGHPYLPTTRKKQPSNHWVIYYFSYFTIGLDFFFNSVETDRYLASRPVR